MNELDNLDSPVAPGTLDQLGISVSPPAVLPADSIVNAELENQVATAKRYPRNPPAMFLRRLVQLATVDADTAAECYYRLPRKKKDGTDATIEGPSIRLAEMAASQWGNVLYGARPVSADKTTVVVMGFCWDLESNVRRAVYVQRKITDRNGRRYSDDMVTVTTNAACAIAARNAVIAVVPRALINQAMKAAKSLAVGDVQSLTDRRNKALAHFAKLGVSEARVLGALSVETVDDIGLDQLEELHGLAGALRDGDTTLEDAFPPLLAGGTGPNPDLQAPTRTGALVQKLTQQGKPNPAAPPKRGPLPRDIGREPGGEG
jgi:hypothetical protein